MGELVSYKTKETEPTGLCMSLVKRDLKCEDVKRKIKNYQKYLKGWLPSLPTRWWFYLNKGDSSCTTKPPDGCN